MTPKNHETDKQAWESMLKENNLTQEEAMEMCDKNEWHRIKQNKSCFMCFMEQSTPSRSTENSGWV